MIRPGPRMRFSLAVIDFKSPIYENLELLHSFWSIKLG